MPTVQELDLVELAYESIPARYHHHITIIEQSKREGDNTWSTVRIPHVKVAGRMDMAMDEHRDAGATLVYGEPQYQAFGDYLIVSVSVTSSLLGTAVGLSCVPLTPKMGVDRRTQKQRDFRTPVEKSSPFEIAHTRAIGRALACFGYGVISGVASYDEIEGVADADPVGSEQKQALGYSKKLAEVEDIMAPNPVTVYDPPIPAVADDDDPFAGMDVQPKKPTETRKHESAELPNSVRPASEKQINYLCSLLAKNGVASGHAHLLVQREFPGGLTSNDASAEIDLLLKNTKASFLLESYAKAPIISPDQWIMLTNDLIEATGHESVYVEGWMDAAFKNRTDADYRRIQAMGIDAIAKDVSMFTAQVENMQGKEEDDDIPF